MEVDKHSMKYALLGLALALLPTTAFACDTYTSVEKSPGTRLLIDEGLAVVVKDSGKEVRYSTGSAGAGTGIRVAFPEDPAAEAFEITQAKGEYWLGPEKFTEYCQ